MPSTAVASKPVIEVKNSAVRQPNGHLLIGCEACGSIGINHTISKTRVSTSQNDAALKTHKQRIEARWLAFEAQYNVLAKASKRNPGAKEELDTLKASFEKEMEELLKAAPKDTSFTRVNTCPWCKKPLNVQVQELVAEEKLL
jgi:hypothetical protein